MYMSRVSRLKPKISTTYNGRLGILYFSESVSQEYCTQDEHNIFGISDRFSSIAIVVHNFFIIQVTTYLSR